MPGGRRMISPQPYLTVASILTGFCISVFMFRIQRELSVRDRHPDWPNWLAFVALVRAFAAFGPPGADLDPVVVENGEGIGEQQQRGRSATGGGNRKTDAARRGHRH